jgi:ribosomal protein L37AE/L43A
MADDLIRDWAAARKALLNERGTEPPCPLCQRPRVRRSDYIRCNPCGTNWLDGEDLSKDPRIERHTQLIASLRMGQRATAQTAESTSDDLPNRKPPVSAPAPVNSFTADAAKPSR